VRGYRHTIMVHVRHARDDVEDSTQRLRLKLLAVHKAQLIAHHARSRRHYLVGPLLLERSLPIAAAPVPEPARKPPQTPPTVSVMKE